LVDRGRRQAIASGFAACLAIYLALLMFTNSADRERWATQMLILRLHQAMVTRTWYDNRTGEELAYDSRWPVIGYPDHVKANPSPKENYFRAVGHWLWALVIGYLGGRFAAWIYDRRHDKQRAPPSSDGPGPGLVPAREAKGDRGKGGHASLSEK